MQCWPLVSSTNGLWVSPRIKLTSSSRSNNARPRASATDLGQRWRSQAIAVRITSSSQTLRCTHGKSYVIYWLMLNSQKIFFVTLACPSCTRVHSTTAACFALTNKSYLFDQSFIWHMETTTEKVDGSNRGSMGMICIHSNCQMRFIESKDKPQHRWESLWSSARTR